MSTIALSLQLTVPSWTGLGHYRGMSEPAAPESTDESLMLAYAAGDDRAFATLYERYRGSLFRFLTRMVRREAIAEELYQETWNRVIVMRSRYEVRAKFSTMIFQIAERLAIDYSRREFVKREQAMDEPVMAMFATDDDPEAVLHDAVLAARVREAIAELPEDQRSALLLHVDGELTLEAIAEMNGLGRETVKSRLRYALNKLRVRLRA